MADINPLILVIEDDPPIRRFLRVTLEAQGYRYAESETARGGLLQVTTSPPDLVILDLGLPDLDGVEVVRKIRAWSTIPIIVVSARGKEQDKVIALDAGADDYLTKPFGVGELTARLRVALRHAATATDSGQPTFSVGDLSVDRTNREVHLAGRLLHLTPNEYRLLSALVEHPGKVLTHQQLLKSVWGPESVEETHYLRVYMNQLRQKLESDSARPRYILTELGVGYRLAAE